MATCNRCGKPIHWQHTYKEFLKLKKTNPDLRNVPLNPDGTIHECAAGDTFRQANDIETFMPERKDKIQKEIIRQTCLKATCTLYQGSTLPADDVIQIARRFEEYVEEG